MGSFLDLTHDANFWTVLLCIAVTLAVISSVAAAAFLYRRRPTAKDELQRHKIHERLSRLNGEAPDQTDK